MDINISKFSYWPDTATNYNRAFLKFDNFEI